MPIQFRGREFQFTQPNGQLLKVRGWGNQRSAVFETLEGFTVLENPATSYFEYATLSPDKTDLAPNGIPVHAANPATLGLQRSVRQGPAAARTYAREGHGLPKGGTRWEQRIAEHRQSRILALAGVHPAPPKRHTVGKYAGLCLLVDFSDHPSTIPPEEVERFCNQAGYTGFGNNGSVYDYFYEVSGTKLEYVNTVLPYYRAKHPRKYYTDPSVAQPIRARELIMEALEHTRSLGRDWSQLSSDGAEYIYALNVFYAGPCSNNWGKGLWPHSHYLASPFELAPSKFAHDYQITNIGSELSIGTFCHENGHMICDFPDLYDYGYQSNGVGVYCLMCSGTEDEKNPSEVCAYLKLAAGWGTATSVDHGEIQLKAKSNEFAVHRRNDTEYFVLENRENTGRDSMLPGSGVAIWHVDEQGDNDCEQMTPARHYECSLEQADGRLHLEKNGNEGDAGDLYSGRTGNVFSETSNPSSKWWDGSVSKLTISEVGPVANTMKITFV